MRCVSRNAAAFLAAVAVCGLFLLAADPAFAAAPAAFSFGVGDHGLVVTLANAAAGIAALSTKGLLERRASVVAEMTTLIEAAEGENRDLTEAEEERFNALRADKDALDKRIARIDGVTASTEGLSTLRPAAARGGLIAHAPGPEARREFETFGQFMHAVRFNPNDQRLNFVEGVGGNAEDFSAANEMRMDTGSTGGFAIPPQFRADLFQEIGAQEAIVRPRATVIPAGDPPDAPITFPALDQSGAAPGNSYGGVQVQWIAEGGAKPQTDASLTDVTLEPHEVAGHIVVTDKLLRNWQAADALLRRLLRGAVLGAEDTAFLRGDGVGKPLGVINADASIKINRTTANSVVYADLVAMLSKMLMRGGSPLWSISQSVLPKLMMLKDENNNYIWRADTANGTTNAADGPAGSLLGYPVRWNNRAPALGSLGDLVLADWQYYLIKDGSGPFVAASQHVKFLENKTVIKIFWNVDGSPWLAAPFLEENGYQVSPFTVLDVPA